MRSALWQALDILGEDADLEQLLALWSVVCDLMWKRLWTGHDGRYREATSGAERVRTLIAAAVDASYIVDGTEPEAVLRRLGLGHFARLGSPPDE